jgi:hypothetical protein
MVIEPGGEGHDWRRSNKARAAAQGGFLKQCAEKVFSLGQKPLSELPPERCHEFGRHTSANKNELSAGERPHGQKWLSGRIQAVRRRS